LCHDSFKIIDWIPTYFANAYSLYCVKELTEQWTGVNIFISIRNGIITKFIDILKMPL